MEFGPRALGNRSILADPRRHDMKDILNKRIKFREPFRPFCPSMLAEATGEFFETDYPSPFMVQAYRIKPQQRERIPAVTHQDGTGRLQTVEKDVNPLYWNLLEALRRSDRRADPDQHLLQRERADRQHPRGGARLLPAHEHGRPGDRLLFPPKVRKSAAVPRQAGTTREAVNIMKILLLNQAFHPDVVSTGQHATDLALELTAAGHEVTVSRQPPRL